MNACIITIGSELLDGTRLDTNSKWITEKIASYGVVAQKIVSIRDDELDICDVISETIDRYTFIFITGGLGPTHDDITIESFKKVFQLNSRVDSDYIKEIEQKFFDRNIVMPKINQNQAVVLDGTDIIDNPIGTARGVYYQHSKSKFFIMPGVPSEMYRMMDDIILPNYIGKPIELRCRTIRTSGIAESRLSEKIENLMSCHSKDFDFSFLPSYKGVDFILKAIKESAELDKAADEFYAEMSPYSFGYENDSFIEFIIGELSENQFTISLAESCTGGFLGKIFTDIPGSSKVFKGGVVAYSNSIKVNQLKVSIEKLDQYGAVSAEVAKEMAQNVMHIFKSTIGLSITGIAGPLGESNNKDVGLVYIALAFKNTCICKKFNFNLNRDLNRKLSCYTALNMIRKVIEE
tara:strand:+ start:153 stop:1370 length:1218 start_codon:yes stop_codon:yes gene_type:complete